MKRFFAITSLIAAVMLSGYKTNALEVVYPKDNSVRIDAASTFFVGNIAPGASLQINNKPVKIWDNGAFVEVVTLNDGENVFVLESQKDNEVKSKTYTIKKMVNSNDGTEESRFEGFDENSFIYAVVVADSTPLRETPDINGRRLAHLGKDTTLIINGKKGKYYRVMLEPDRFGWVDESKIFNQSVIKAPIPAKISDVSLDSDKNYEYIKTAIDIKVPFIVKELHDENGLEVDIFGVGNNVCDNKIFKPLDSIKNLAIATTETTKVSKYFIELNHKNWGYDVFYDENNLVIKIRKAPKIDAAQPLKNITIAIDAGHGGKDNGSIGPTGVKEKELTLDMSMKLKKLLEESGAMVVMTRVDDSDIPLFERPQLAKASDALILVSLHANALPDGANPYEKHGTSVFYYNDESKDLALTIKNTLINDLGTKDDGLVKRSFVLTRPTMPLSVLIETAYMIHPSEYTLLLDEKFRDKAVTSIKNALENYLKNVENK